MYRKFGRSTSIYIIAGVMCLLAATHLSGADITLDEFVRAAVEESSSIADAAEALEDALENISPSYDIDGLRLSVSGSGNYRPDPAPSQDAFSPSASANLSIPVIPQISLSASVSTDFESVDSNYTLSVSPFASPQVTYKEIKAYEQAALQLISISASVPYQFESSAYNLILAELSTALAREKLDLEATQYAISKEQYEIGDLSWSEYNAAVDSYSAAQRSVFDAERSELSTRRQLADLVGVALGSAAIIAPDIEAVETELASRKERIEVEAADAQTTGVITTEIELKALESELAATPILEPTLSISAKAGLPFSSVQGSVSLTLSPSQYNGEERALLQSDIAEKTADLAVEQLSLEFEIDILKRQIESAERLYSSSVASVENAQISFEETSYLHAAGDRTDIELEEARINLKSAYQNRYKNAVSLLSVYADFLQLIDIGQMSK